MSHWLEHMDTVLIRSSVSSTTNHTEMLRYQSLSLSPFVGTTFYIDATHASTPKIRWGSIPWRPFCCNKENPRFIFSPYRKSAVQNSGASIDPLLTAVDE